MVNVENFKTEKNRWLHPSMKCIARYLSATAGLSCLYTSYDVWLETFSTTGAYDLFVCVRMCLFCV